MPQINAALLLIRIACAAAFFYHGSGILFGAFGGPGPEKFAANLHAPAIVGYLVGIGQLFGAITVLLGLFTRIGAACIAIIMIGAIVLVHLPHHYDPEYALTQLLIALALLLTGPGAYSIAARLPPPVQKL